MYKSSKESGCAFFDDVDEAILKGKLSGTEENDLLIKSEIVEKFIKVVENSDNSYFGEGQQQAETSKSSRSNPFGKTEHHKLNSREEIRKKLAFGGLGNNAQHLTDNDTKKQGWYFYILKFDVVGSEFVNTTQLYYKIF